MNFVEREREKILVRNIALLLALAGTILAFIFIALHSLRIATGPIIVAISMPMVLFFLKRELLIFSQVWILMISNTAIFVYSSLMGFESGIQIMFSVIIFLPIVWFEDKKLKLAMTIMPIANYLTLEIFNYSLFPLIIEQPHTQRAIFTTMLLSAIIINLLVIYYYVQEVQENNRISLNKKNRQIKDLHADAIQLKLNHYGRLIEDLIHELKSPLQAIYGCLNIAMIELKKKRIDIPIEITQYIKVSESKVKGLTELVDSMLTLDVSHWGKKELVDISHILRLVFIFLERKAKENNCRIQIHHSNEKVIANNTRLNVAIHNLVENAIEAIGTKKTKGLIQINTYTDELNDQVVIEIKDNGPGIPEEIENTLFDPHVTTKPDHQGLGLAIVEKIIRQAHDGDIEWESLPNEGSLFKIILPKSTEDYYSSELNE